MSGGLLVVATGGAGGDLQPLLAAALALQERGRRVSWVGDAGVARTLAKLDIEADMLDPNLDLGPRLVSAVREAQTLVGDDPQAPGRIVQTRLGEWATEVAHALRRVIEQTNPSAVVTSLFGVEAVALAEPACPWSVINSTFYIGPNAPRALTDDVAARAIPLIRRYRDLLDQPDLVLHGTDQQFDFGFDALPPHHHYVGPLGIWEPSSPLPTYLDEPGDPWVLVTISSQVADDIPLAQAAIEALSSKAVRVLVTIGPDHEPAELSAVPANCVIERVASHRAVLERGVMLVSHAGHGSVMKALWHGRPMVLVPWGRDQPGVAERARALGVAEVVPREGASADKLSLAIDAVLKTRAMADRANLHLARLRRTDPAGDAADLLDSLIQG